MLFVAKNVMFERNNEGDQKDRKRSHSATLRTFCEPEAVAVKKHILQQKGYSATPPR